MQVGLHNWFICAAPVSYIVGTSKIGKIRRNDKFHILFDDLGSHSAMYSATVTKNDYGMKDS